MVLTWLRSFAALSENPHLHIEAHMNMYTQLYSKFKVSLGCLLSPKREGEVIPVRQLNIKEKKKIYAVSPKSS